MGRVCAEHRLSLAADELPIPGAVIDQDMQNMPFVQRGLRASGSAERRSG
jgi:hypothetical protein